MWHWIDVYFANKDRGHRVDPIPIYGKPGLEILEDRLLMAGDTLIWDPPMDQNRNPTSSSASDQSRVRSL